MTIFKCDECGAKIDKLGESLEVSVTSKNRKITVAFSILARYEKKTKIGHISGGMDLCRRCAIEILRKAKVS